MEDKPVRYPDSFFSLYNEEFGSVVLRNFYLACAVRSGGHDYWVSLYEIVQEAVDGELYDIHDRVMHKDFHY